MLPTPTLIAVFESKSTWQKENPVLSKSGYGRFLEDDESIAAIIEEVSSVGVPARPWPLSTNSLQALLREIEHTRNPLVWNLTDGYDYHLGSNIPALVQLARVPHMASGSYAQMLCQNKHHLKAVAKSAGIPVAEGVVMAKTSRHPHAIPPALQAPFFVKPARLGNSIGDEIIPPICANAPTALRAVRTLMEAGISEVSIEEFLPGREFSVVAANGGIWKMACAEIWYDADYFDSSAKDSENYRLDFASGHKADEMIASAMLLAEVANLRDYFRVDFRCDPEGRPKLLEVNSHPFLVSNAFNKFAILQFQNRGNMFRSIIEQSYARQSHLHPKRPAEQH